MCRGMVFKTKNEFYLCTGRTPCLARAARPSLITLTCTSHICYVGFEAQGIRLKQLPYMFNGPLPDVVEDESKISNRETTTENAGDPLSKDDSSPALGLELSSRLECALTPLCMCSY